MAAEKEIAKSLEAIKTRRSVRNYSGIALTEEHKAQVFEYIKDEQNLLGPLGNTIRIAYKEIADVKSNKKIGTYGFIKNAPAFLICSCENNRENLLDLGVVFEDLILFFQSIGIHSCWLGGTFDRKKLQGEYKLPEDAFIPIISPLGYGADRPHLFEKVIRKAAKSDNRKDFDLLFFMNDFKTRISDPSLREILEYVRLAPSASNKQPWRVVISDNQIAHFFIERTPKYGDSLGYDIQMVDIGIALAHYIQVCGKKDVFEEKPAFDALNERCTYVLSVR